MSDGFYATFNEDKSELPVERPENTEGQAGQPRDESGRFAPKAAEPAPKPEATPAQPAPAATQQAPAPVAEPAKAEPGHIPISALLDEREKRQKLERRLAELEQQTRQPETAPSFQTPEEIAAYVQREAADARWQATANFSEYSAREKHGDETVNAALEWSLERVKREIAQNGFSPFAVEQMRQQHPIDWVVRQHKRDLLASEIGDDAAAYKAKLRAEIEAEIAAQTQAPQPVPQAQASPQPAATKPAPRPSLASAPTAGGIQTVVVKEPFEAAFK